VVASPRNHLDLQRLLLRGGGAGLTGVRHCQDPCQIAPEFDLELAVDGSKHDRVNQATDQLEGLPARRGAGTRWRYRQVRKGRRAATPGVGKVTVTRDQISPRAAIIAPRLRPSG
jgi:hypothetical protein